MYKALSSPSGSCDLRILSLYWLNLRMKEPGPRDVAQGGVHAHHAPRHRQKGKGLNFLEAPSIAGFCWCHPWYRTVSSDGFWDKCLGLLDVGLVQG